MKQAYNSSRHNEVNPLGYAFLSGTRSYARYGIYYLILIAHQGLRLVVFSLRAICGRSGNKFSDFFRRVLYFTMTQVGAI